MLNRYIAGLTLLALCGAAFLQVKSGEEVLHLSGSNFADETSDGKVSMQHMRVDLHY
jgi:hypothetical protein